MSQTILTRANLHLFLLSGRSGGFANPHLNTGVGYSSPPAPDEVVRARALMGISPGQATDYCALACLAASKISLAFQRGLPPDGDGVFQGGLLSLPPISSTAELIAPTGHSWPSFDGGPAGAAGFSRVTFTEAGGTAAVVTDSGASSTSAYDLSAEDGGATYRLAFADAGLYGIRAHFRVASFSEGEAVTVTLSPTRYPFARVAGRIGSDYRCGRLMTAEGTMQAFGETPDPARKVGFAALAVISRMARLSEGSGQPAFEVSRDAGGALSPVVAAGLYPPTITEEGSPDLFDA